jgi:hypothetical protein
MANSTAVSESWPVGYWRWTRAVLRMLSVELAWTSPQAFAFVGGEGGHEDQADDAGGGGGGVGDHRPAVGVADQQHGAVNLG